MISLLLMLACETTVVGDDPDSGGGDNDSEDVVDDVFYDLDTVSIGVNNPEGLALGPDGALYLSDSDLEEVVRVDPETGAVTAYTSGGHIGDAQGLAFLGDGRLVVCDRTNDALQVFDAQASFVRTVSFAAGMGPNTPLLGPDGLIWVTSRNTNSLATVSPSGWSVADQVLVDVELQAPEGATWLDDGRLAVVARSSNLVKVYDVVAGEPVLPGVQVLQSPDLTSGEGVAQAPDGTLWVASRDSSEVVHVDLHSSSVIERFAVTSGQPMGMLVTPSGAVYTATRDGGTLVRVTQR